MITQDAWFQEDLGAALYVMGYPASECATHAALRGWEAAQEDERSSDVQPGQIALQLDIEMEREIAEGRREQLLDIEDNYDAANRWRY